MGQRDVGGPRRSVALGRGAGLMGLGGRWRRGTVGVMIAAALALALVAPAAADGHHTVGDSAFFSQAGPGDGTGYAVADVDGQEFFKAFNDAGGVDALGYPISRRYEFGVFVRQAFQRGVMQWDPNTGGITFANLMDEVEDREGTAEGLPVGEWLLSKWQIPESRYWSADGRRTWPEVMDAHLALLKESAVIRDRFFAAPNWLDLYGLPMGFVDLGPVRTLRAQRAVFQHWTDAEPWGPAGSVAPANVGDLARAAGMFSDGALQSHGADTVPVPAEAEPPEEPPSTPTYVTPRVVAMDGRAELPGIAIAEAVAMFVESTAADWGWRPAVAVTFYLHGSRGGYSDGIEATLGTELSEADRSFYETSTAAVAIRRDVVTGGRAVVIKLEQADGSLMDIEVARVLLAHEYTHVMQFDFLSRLQPSWFVEGMADVVAFSNFPDGVGQYGYDTSIPAALRDGTLPSLRSLHEDWGSYSDRLPLAYGTAYYGVNYLAGQIGGMAILQILSDVDAGAGFEDALSAHGGYSLESLDAALRDWMQATLVISALVIG